MEGRTGRSDILKGASPGDIIRYFTKTPPPDVLGIAKALGLQVLEEELGPTIAGIIKSDPVGDGTIRYSIIVNSADPYFRKRFTLAHEVAHFLLHRDKITHSFKEDRMYRSPLGGQLEEQANRLAADILMPRRLIRELLEQGIKTPAGLAAQFQVSLPAMEVRLGLHSRLNRQTKTGDL
jgi:hypothetical protein